MGNEPNRGGLASLAVPELFDLACRQERSFGGLDQWPSPAWYAYQELQYRGTQEVFIVASTALGANDSVERRVGADVLGQLGYREGGTFVKESIDVLIDAAARDQNPDVLHSIAHALGHRASPDGRKALVSLARHPSADVRQAVASGLPAVAIEDAEGNDDDSEVVDVLIELTHDSDESVRDWATFSLGTQLSADGTAIRQALRERLSDGHDDTREEAVCGLANRRDEIAFDPLMNYLQSGDSGTGCIDAAGSWGDPRFLDVLNTIRATQPDVATAADAAIEAIRNANPGVR